MHHQKVSENNPAIFPNLGECGQCAGFRYLTTMKKQEKTSFPVLHAYFPLSSPPKKNCMTGGHLPISRRVNNLYAYLAWFFHGFLEGQK